MELRNRLATADQLAAQLDRHDPLSPSSSASVRFRAVRLVQLAGVLLRLGQETVARAIVTFDRYWLVTAAAPRERGLLDAAVASMYLAAKLSAYPQSPRAILNAFYFLRVHEYSLLSSTPMLAPEPSHRGFLLSEGDYLDKRHRLLQTEMLILRAIGFSTSVVLPYTLALNYLRTLDVQSHPREAQVSARTIALLNTALLSPQLVYLTHQPSSLAVAAIYLAARELAFKLPELAWWELFDVDREELGFLVVAMLSTPPFAAKVMELAVSQPLLPE